VLVPVVEVAYVLLPHRPIVLVVVVVLPVVVVVEVAIVLYMQRLCVLYVVAVLGVLCWDVRELAAVLLTLTLDVLAVIAPGLILVALEVAPALVNHLVFAPIVQVVAGLILLGIGLPVVPELIILVAPNVPGSHYIMV